MGWGFKPQPKLATYRRWGIISSTYIVNVSTYIVNVSAYIVNASTYIANASADIANVSTYIANASADIANASAYIINVVDYSSTATSNSQFRAYQHRVRRRSYGKKFAHL